MFAGFDVNDKMCVNDIKLNHIIEAYPGLHSMIMKHSVER